MRPQAEAQIGAVLLCALYIAQCQHISICLYKKKFCPSITWYLQAKT